MHFEIRLLTISCPLFNRHIIAKTRFTYKPEKGEAELVQKLPIDWHAFNHKPNWRVSMALDPFVHLFHLCFVFGLLLLLFCFFFFFLELFKVSRM